jgi:hypothetical protein
MTTNSELLKTRFLLNMGRISGLVRLLNSSDALRPTGIFQSEEARADILRSIVVFLHATFEVVVRGFLPNPNKSLSIYSSTDLDKALKLSRIDTTPFKPLYPPLTQMAKRRKRIVHEADLAKRTDTVSEAWGVADDWQLMMWLMAVPAFYYQLLISVNAASLRERTLYDRHREAMKRHVEFGNQLLALPRVLPELRTEALRRIVVTLDGIVAILRLDVSALDHP